MKVAIVLAAALFTTAASASPGWDDFRERWLDARYMCGSGETHDGEVVQWTEVQEACDEQKDLERQMTAAGLCYAGDMEWTACK